MDWATIFVGFVIVFSIFSSNLSSSKPVIKTASLPNIAASATVADETISDFAPDISSTNISELNQYQVIVSYIMDNYKQVTITDVLSIAESIVASAIEYSIDPYLIAALISVESSFNKNAISKTGAKGLGQIKDFNFKRLGITDPFDIKQNVRGSTQFIKELHVQWVGNARYAIASYLEGATGIKNQEGSSWKQSTNDYVDKILLRYKQLQTFK
ncbi:MAG: hypothetical protein A2Y40_01440 [Candidatus Margulisbacteria bacterium GWF2_35_9]|nr:MAG: hypothetical protein A2Y40_01440 [Candidatus Margulisbacteria bacterium GWF2_35_9]